jgi:hypothetical protein
MTQNIDQELLGVIKQWPPAFWRPLHDNLAYHIWNEYRQVAALNKSARCSGDCETRTAGALDMTQNIDQELLGVIKQWPPAFWRPLQFQGLEVDSADI